MKSNENAINSRHVSLFLTILPESFFLSRPDDRCEGPDFAGQDHKGNAKKNSCFFPSGPSLRAAHICRYVSDEIDGHDSCPDRYCFCERTRSMVSSFLSIYKHIHICFVDPN